MTSRKPETSLVSENVNESLLIPSTTSIAAAAICSDPGLSLSMHKLGCAQLSFKSTKLFLSSLLLIEASNSGSSSACFPHHKIHLTGLWFSILKFSVHFLGDTGMKDSPRLQRHTKLEYWGLVRSADPYNQDWWCGHNNVEVAILSWNVYQDVVCSAERWPTLIHATAKMTLSHWTPHYTSDCPTWWHTGQEITSQVCQQNISKIQILRWVLRPEFPVKFPQLIYPPFFNEDTCKVWSTYIANGCGDTKSQRVGFPMLIGAVWPARREFSLAMVI